MIVGYLRDMDAALRDMYQDLLHKIHRLWGWDNFFLASLCLHLAIIGTLAVLARVAIRGEMHVAIIICMGGIVVFIWRYFYVAMRKWADEGEDFLESIEGEYIFAARTFCALFVAIIAILSFYIGVYAALYIILSGGLILSILMIFASLISITLPLVSFVSYLYFALCKTPVVQD